MVDPDKFLGLDTRNKPILIDWYPKGCRVRVAWGRYDGGILEKSWFIRWDPDIQQIHIIQEGFYWCEDFK